ncbi:MAG: hypothetical protein IKN11_08935 [Bacteroidales bacterium]|nr:hypothetical protein [Bacteroidales bacterium]
MKVNIFFLILLSAAWTAAAQSNVWVSPGIPSDTSIVRQWRGQEYIVYSRLGTMPGVMAYHDNAAGVIRRAVLPGDMVINDFRISRDTVYAGGSVMYGGHQVGMLGCFAIGDLLSGSFTFYWTRFSVSYMGLTDLCRNDSYDQVTGVKRLEVFQCGRTMRQHVAYISDNLILRSSGDYSSIMLRRIGCGDAEFYNHNWILNDYHYNKDGREKYTDITLTDNHVVVVSFDSDYYHFRFELYDKVFNFAHSIPPPGGTVVYDFSDHVVEGRVMAAAITGDMFAAAYHYHDPSGDCGLAIKWISVSGGVPTLQYSVDIPLSSTSSMAMRDVRYSPQTNSLWLLSDEVSQATGVWGSYIHRIDMGNVYAGLYEERYYSGYKLYSLDGFVGGGHITSGVNPGTGFLSIGNETMPAIATHCYAEKAVTGKKTTPDMTVGGHHQCSTGPIRFYYEYTALVTVDQMNRQCFYPNKQNGDE